MGAKANNDLIAFGVKFTLDGDLLKCSDCHNTCIATRSSEDFHHRFRCRWQAERRPWVTLRELIEAAEKEPEQP